jgi:hypothetical protein
MDNGQPAHVPVPDELRAPMAGTIDRAALHDQARQILDSDPKSTNENKLSLFNLWMTGRSRSFPQLGDTQSYDFLFETLENNDGTLTDARCTVPMPGWMPTTTPDDWPALLDLCVNLPYRDANPAAVSAWAKDAVKQLQATTPGPTPVVQMVDLNCLHWQVGWQQDIDKKYGYLGLISLDASTGFSPLTPTRGFDGTQPDHPTAYGCPG